MAISLTKPIRIDLTTLVKEVREVAAAEPEFCYDAPGGQCYYAHGKMEYNPEYDVEIMVYDGVTLTPGCIMGKALHQMGVPLEEFVAPGDEQGGVISNMLSMLSIRGVISFVGDDPSLIRWCQTVQRMQDDGESWSDSVKRADEAN